MTEASCIQNAPSGFLTADTTAIKRSGQTGDGYLGLLTALVCCYQAQNPEDPQVIPTHMCRSISRAQIEGTIIVA